MRTPEHRGIESAEIQGECAVIVGGGINGMICANYLAKAGFSVTLIERAEQTGGACVRRTLDHEGQQLVYPGGASVFGFMQDFVYEETGLKDRMQGRTHFSGAPVAYSFTGQPHLGALLTDDDFRSRCSEAGRLEEFEHDAERVVAFLQHGYREGTVPTLASAQAALGKKLTALWLEGSARELTDHYLTSDAMKITQLTPVNESGAGSIDERYSAANIPIMHSGSVAEGEWGFVQGGLWNLMTELQKLNDEAGVQTITSATVQHADDKSKQVTYQDADGKQHTVPADKIVFATEPLTAARILGDKTLESSIQQQELLGTAGKLVMFFRSPVRWKDAGIDDDMFQYIFATDTVDDFERAAQSVRDGSTPYTPGYFEVYPEAAADRRMGADRGDDMLSIYFKHLALGKKGHELPEIRSAVERVILDRIVNGRDHMTSVLLTPRDLQQQFLFAQGNIDHTEISKGQTLWDRGYSVNPAAPYQFGDHENVFYCGAGAYPCGSVAGTPGYMCARGLMKND